MFFVLGRDFHADPTVLRNVERRRPKRRHSTWTILLSITHTHTQKKEETEKKRIYYCSVGLEGNIRGNSRTRRVRFILFHDRRVYFNWSQVNEYGD